MSHPLNPQQEAAVVHHGGPVVVFAGAGSGKTRVITHRIAHLVAQHGVPPWRILAVTFTNKAAQEMRERVAALLERSTADLWVGTFHATCARILRRYHESIGVARDFTIYDDADQRAMITRVMKDLNVDERRISPKTVAARINRAKQEVVAPDALREFDFIGQAVSRIYPEYEVRMRRSSAMDFGDLIYQLVRALERDPTLHGEITGRWDHVLVDEFQDTNHVQYRLLRALCARHRNLFVVGDDDQSIYKWRGADRRNILDFNREFPGASLIKLEQNYRSTQRILRVANAVISRNVDREPKQLWTENDVGGKVAIVGCEDERDEAELVVRAIRELRNSGRSLREAAVFYRIHAQSRVLEEALRAVNIPYRIYGGTRFYDRAEIKDLLAYLRVIHNPDDDINLLRIINTPARGIGKNTIERVFDAAAQRGIGLFRMLESADTIAELSTGAQKKLAAFVELMHAFRREGESSGLSQLGQTVLDGTGYVQMLRVQDTPEADARLMNLQELIGSMSEFEHGAEEPSLANYLELVSLQTDADRGTHGEELTLMTVHAAKGLEFPAVFVTGLEERMFPFIRADEWEKREDIEEERRLAYVAFTRAREQLVLTHARVRRVFGRPTMCVPSRFLDEIGAEDVERIGSQRSSRPPSYGRADVEYEPSEVRRPTTPHSYTPGRRPAGESYVDRSESDVDDDMLRKGMRVRHKKFGVGEIRSIVEGVPPSAQVAFPGWGVRKIVVSFLEPL